MNWSWLAWCFADHLFGILIFPQTQKDGLPELSIPRPFREFDLTNKGWFDPMTPFHLRRGDSLTVTASLFLGKICKRTFRSRELIEPLMKAFEQRFIKTGA